MVDVDNEAGRKAILGVLRRFDLGPEHAAMIIEALKSVTPNNAGDALLPLAQAYAAFFRGLIAEGLTREEALAMATGYLQANAAASHGQ
jgi:hypothetical protein